MKTKTIGFFNIPESSESDEKLTTVSELIALTGLSRNTILSAIKTVYPDAIINGKKTVLTQQQVDMVKHQLAVQHQKLINLVNDDTFQNGKVTFQNGQVTQQQLQEISLSVGKILLPIITETVAATISATLKSLPQAPLPQLPPPVARQRVAMLTIDKYCDNHNISLSRNDRASRGREATKLSVANGYTVKRVSDELWGTVNAYREDVLDTIFDDVLRKIL